MLKNDTIIFTKRRNNCKLVQGFPVLYHNSMKAFRKKDMVQNVSDKIKEKLDFGEYSNFNTGSTEAVVGKCPGVNSQENTRDEFQ